MIKMIAETPSWLAGHPLVAGLLGVVYVVALVLIARLLKRR